MSKTEKEIKTLAQFDEAEADRDIWDEQMEASREYVKQLREMILERNPQTAKDVILRLLEISDCANYMMTGEQAKSVLRFSKHCYHRNSLPDYLADLLPDLR